MLKRIIYLLLLLIPIFSFAQLERVEPPNWWVGMENNMLQLLVKNPKIHQTTPSINYKGVRISEVHEATSENYLFIDLEISKDAKPGIFEIVFKSKNGNHLTHLYQLLDREILPEDYVGFNSQDAIYLITPDRFANGDYSNDIDKTLEESTINRADDYGRHGGDIKGITKHLDYISDLGFTAVWPSPLLINNMPSASYHGYAITDLYQVDPRFGTLQEYKELATTLRKKDMKLIMDMVANHCGSNHWWMQDFPFNDWVNQQSKFENKEPINNSNHRRTTHQDPYASKRDQAELQEGWFVEAMPDLNQRNPFMATYIIQNNIWWIETLQLGGIRQDTYPYSDKNFMANWAKAIMTEYPNFSIVGEEWSLNPLLIAYWQTGNKNADGYESNLKSTMDFAMQKNSVDAINEPEKWDQGLVKIYEGLANDFSYKAPKDIMAFMDNHDMSRVFTQLNQDLRKTQMALGYLLTLPRIPQIYYGTEILMSDHEKPGDHGLIRTDFPGGWKTDTINAFSGEGLSADQKEMQNFMKVVLNYRKSSSAITRGETIHFSPFMGTYFMFRTFEAETVVVILNKNDHPITIDLKRYSEMGLDGDKLTNIVTGNQVKWSEVITLNTRGITILSTKK
tara:strand:+ start:290111 stop:291976 length:1866 start_codon:yes stop_codon:yes gene_type:complete